MIATPEVRIPADVIEKFESDKYFHHQLKWYRPTAVGIIGDEEGRVLLVQSTKMGNWHFPQGGICEHESILEGLRRELREETGIDAHAWHRFCHHDIRDTPETLRDGFTSGKRYYYVYGETRDHRVRVKRDEICAFQWLFPHHVRELLLNEECTYPAKARSMLIALHNAL